MAVYTPIKKEKLSSFLENYNIGSLENFKGVLEGVENTNYKIITSQDTFILTIFEKRVKEQELPFFIELQNHLSKKNIKCPSPISNRNDRYVNTIENKPCVLMSFLEGKKTDNSTSYHCHQIGELTAKIHLNSKDFTLTRNNGLHQKHWRDIFNKCQKSKDSRYGELYQVIEQELQYLDKKWPRNLPIGIIHGDIFPDNVFFIDSNVSGLIDFYFSCNDFYAYDLAITANAWCFDKKKSFKKENFDSLLKGYQQHVNISNDEKNHFNTLLRGAAMRFLVTRLHDQLYHPDGAMVVPKDPFEFFNILKWHQNNPIFDL
jgi:homoserine kinase type II